MRKTFVVRRVNRASALALLFLVLLLVPRGILAQTKAGNCPGATHPTIQDAVDGTPVGGIVNVCPGTFNQSVRVNKPLTLLGNQAGVDGRNPVRHGPPVPASESLVQGILGITPFRVSASDVRIDGFTIQGNNDPVAYGAGVVVDPGFAGFELVNNIIQNNVAGLYLANNSASNQSVIQFNLFRNNNQRLEAVNSGIGIYTDELVSGGTLQNVLITNNTFEDHRNAAVMIGALSVGSHTNITFTNNLCWQNRQSVVLFDTQAATINNNIFRNAHFSFDSQDVRILQGSGPLTIVSNTFENGLARAMQISNTGSGDPLAFGVEFRFNSISGYDPGGNGFEVVDVDPGAYSGTLGAHCNFWGHPSGPTHAGNPGGTGMRVSDGVGFIPWLEFPGQACPTLVGLGPGCPQPALATVQAGVDTADPGTVIQVCKGIFNEQVTVNKSVTLRGARYGLDARDPARTGFPDTESVMAGNAGSTSFHVTASDVRIDGFTIQDASSGFFGGVVSAAGTAGLDLVNNIIRNNVVGLMLANNSGTNQALIQYNLFRSNNVPGPASGSAIYSDQFSAGGTLQNVLIDSNTFLFHQEPALNLLHTSAGTPATNIVFSNNLSEFNSRGFFLVNTTNSIITGNTFRNATGIDLVIAEGSFNLSIVNNTLMNGVSRALQTFNLGTGSPSATAVEFHFNSITGYPQQPVVNITAAAYTGTFNADCNWWGSSSGPSHPSNPAGTGTSVSNQVDYRRWLDTPPPGGTCFGGITLNPTQGTPQSTTVGSEFATPLQATATDEGSPAVAIPVTFTAVPGPNGASGTFTGPTTVNTDASGIATAPPLTANSIGGPFTVTATAGSLSATFSLFNDRIPSLTTLVSSQNPSQTGQMVTFTATVNSPPGVATGSVVFRDGPDFLDDVPLDGSAVASYSTSALSAGNHSITAHYLGDNVYEPSSSSPVVQTVQGVGVVRAWVAGTGSDANPCSRTQPCRTFGAAVAVVNSGGEIAVLDSAGYGAFTINKAVSIIVPAGIHAAIAPTGGEAIGIATALNDVVVLRGLYLNSQGALTGVHVSSGGVLYVENCVVSGFQGAGVEVENGAELFVSQSVLRSNIWGIAVFSESQATIDRSRVEANDTGVEAGGNVIFRRSVAARNETGLLGSGGNLFVDRSSLIGNLNGLNTSFGESLVSQSVVAMNAGVGVLTGFNDAIIRISGTTIIGNDTGVAAYPGSQILSRGDNRLAGNTTDGAFTGTFPQQ